MSDTNFFPTIGSLADKMESLDDLPKDAPISSDDLDLSADEDRPMQEIESLCMKCGEQGVTRLLLTNIPYFREVILMSFRCQHCGTQNNEIQSAGTIRPEGSIYTARILSRADLDRQIVRSPTCSIMIPEFSLTLPSTTRGQLTTVEGLVRDIVADLGTDQPVRKYQDEEGWKKIEELLGKLKEILADEEEGEEGKEEAPTDLILPKKAAYSDLPMPPFTVRLDDPAGNSFIEFIGSMADPKWNMRTYERTRQNDIDLGIVADEQEVAAPAGLGVLTEEVVGEHGEISNPMDEIYVFRGTCSSCSHPLDTLMKKVSIPYFKDILIMSTNCDRCGYRDNEVKSGSAISAQGKRITLKVEDREDLSRDILKSETSGLSIPEIDLVLQPGTLGGRFTTLEGILEQVYEELSEKVIAGDSKSTSDVTGKNDFTDFLVKLKAVKNAERPFTLILDDPLANSYIQNLYAPDPDPAMTIEMYDRTWEQDEELGLNDIKVEGYGEGSGGEAEWDDVNGEVDDKGATA